MADWPDDVDDTVHEQLDDLDTLEDSGLADVLDRGYSPPERPWAVGGWGTTGREEATGEGLDARLARELPDVGWSEAGDGLGDSSDTDGELLDEEVGDLRSGRLEPSDVDGDLVARDVGIDGAGASAEEGAMHLVPDSPDDRG